MIDLFIVPRTPVGVKQLKMGHFTPPGKDVLTMFSSYVTILMTEQKYDHNHVGGYQRVLNDL
jgi:hypothetical protein